MEKQYVHDRPYNDYSRGERQGGEHYYYDANHNPPSSHVQSPAQPNVAPHQPPPYAEPNGPPTSPYQMYAKPPQTNEWMEQMNGPYPQAQQAQTKNPNPIMTHFYDENGQIDLQKMLSTVNQLANTFQQVTPVIQQIGSLIRLVR